MTGSWSLRTLLQMNIFITVPCGVFGQRNDAAINILKAEKLVIWTCLQQRLNFSRDVQEWLQYWVCTYSMHYTEYTSRQIALQSHVQSQIIITALVTFCSLINPDTKLFEQQHDTWDRAAYYSYCLTTKFDQTRSGK